MLKTLGTENLKFAKKIEGFRLYFKLSQNDMASLMGITHSVYKSLEKGKGVDLDKIDLIARVYGLRYWEFLNPDLKIVNEGNLPAATRKLVIDRKDTKRNLKGNELHLPEKVKAVLFSGKLDPEFTASEVYKLLPKKTKEIINSGRVTDALTKGMISKMIEETGEKRSREKLYRLKK